MKRTRQEFLQWENKAITLLGMSGVGKTTLSSLLPNDQWFHYSGDYRIGKRYLDEAILDEVKKMAMEHPFLRSQLCNDSIYIRNNITVNHLGPMSDYLGKIGNPELGGLPVEEFKRRQSLYRAAEVQAMHDVDEFIDRAKTIYRYPHFINDAGGSICSFSDDECWNQLSTSTMVLYLEANEDMEEILIERARKHPKPVNYEEDFLDQHLVEYLEQNGLESTNQIVPDEFVQWIFPCLLNWRRPQYRAIAERHGHIADASKILDLRDPQDFLDFICEAIDESS
ncbi:MAG: ATPase [bacterium]